MDIRDSDGGVPVVSQRSHVVSGAVARPSASSDAFRAASTAPVHEQPLSLDEHAELMLMGGYEAADVPDGMECLIGTLTWLPPPPTPPRTRCVADSHSRKILLSNGG